MVDGEPAMNCAWQGSNHWECLHLQLYLTIFRKPIQSSNRIQSWLGMMYDIHIYIYTQIDIDIWYRYRYIYIYILDIDIDRFRYRYTRLPWLHMTTMSLSIPVASLWLVMEIPASPGVFRSYLFGIQKRSIRKLRCRYRKWIWMNILPIWIVYL